MKVRWRRGASDLDAILILAVLIIVFISTPRGSGGGSPWDFVPDTAIKSSREERAVHPTLSRAISLGMGNAPYAYQPYEEYMTIDNTSDNPINITNWQLKNGKDKRIYNQGGSLQRFSADIAVIPKAALLLSPTGNNVFQDVVLGDGERAIITTGSVGIQSPYKIVSFKENMCTGYLEASSDYAFSPALSLNCPRPEDEPGAESLDRECRDFLRNFSSCRSPVFGGKDRDGENCPECVNGELISSSCRAFVEEHFSYKGCVAYHGSNPKFYGRTWRIFLGRGWEMWAKDYESIELFNETGQLVDYQNY